MVPRNPFSATQDDDGRSVESPRESFAPLSLLGRALVYPATVPRPLWTFPICGLLLLPANVVAFVPLWTLFGAETIRTIYLVSLVPGILPLGYYVLVIRSVSSGEEDPPALRLSAWRELLVLGTKATVIYVVFFLYPQTIFRFLGVAGGPPGQAGVEILTNALGRFRSVVVTFVVFMYVYPAAVSNFARDGRLRDGFDPTLIISTITDRRYAVGAAIAGAITLASSSVIRAIFAVDLRYVGWGTVSAPALVLVGFLSFYLGTSLNYVVGRTWAEVSRHRRSRDEDSDDDLSGGMARQLEVLTHLHDRGLLDDEEYRSKRGELLDRLEVEPAETAIVDRFRDLYRLHAAGLLTDGELEAKTRALFENAAGPRDPHVGSRSNPGTTDQADGSSAGNASDRLREEGLLSEAEVERLRRATSEPGEAGDRRTGRGTPTLTERLDALESLRSAGLMTDEEFDEKRRELSDLE